MSNNSDDEFLEILRQSWSEVQGARLIAVEAGMSGANVFRVERRDTAPRFLKYATGASHLALQQEIVRTAWLATHNVAVARVVRSLVTDEASALLTDAAAGHPANATEIPVSRLAKALGSALRSFHNVDARACPFDETIPVRLARAHAAVDAGEVDAAHFAERNHAVSPSELLQRLSLAPPADDVVLVHGDATLSNMFVTDNGAVTFIDCGHAGRGDRYLDLAVLVDDMAETYGNEGADALISAYHARDDAHAWDASKAAYYLDLYELF